MKVHGIEDIDDFLAFIRKFASPDDIKIMEKAADEITENIVEEEADENEVADALTTFYGLGTLLGVRLVMEALRDNLLVSISRQTCPIGILELIIEHKKKREGAH